MSFADWQIFNGGFTGFTGLDGNQYPACNLVEPAAPPATFPPAFTNGPYVTMAHGLSIASCTMCDSALVTGVALGSMEVNVKLQIIDGYIEGPFNFGLMVMQNQTDMRTGNGGTGYALMLDAVNLSHAVKLCRVSDGASSGVGGSLATTYTLLGASATQLWSPGSTYRLRLFWWSDPYYLRGTWLVGSLIQGGTTTPLFNLVDTGAGSIASTTSAGQSIYAFCSTNAGAVFFDDVTLDDFTGVTVNGVAYPPP